MKRKKILILRINHGLNQESFGETLGVTGQYISMIEKGKANGSYKFWHRLKTVYNIPDSEMESYRDIEE